ncbi:MAG: bifunctional aldolase/short-chain dehydrogenase [Chloroflexi bacterium]|nr:bifunctional aldolase/short-chain dehydrogenase [Chloroflexota bacterium]
MRSLWSDQEAASYRGDLALRVYTSRLLGQDKSLVLHGGGNTSVKIRQRNILGEEEDILYVKASGWDLETIEEAGFAPARLAPLLRLASLKSLSDSQMMNELRASFIRADAPAPSVETLLHAILPHKYVDHTHADAMLAVTNTRDGMDRIKEIYGNRVVAIPYVMPGFDLARACAEHLAGKMDERTLGIVLMNHGIVSFGESAKVSYHRMIELVTRAERYLADHGAWDLLSSNERLPLRPVRRELAELRRAVANAAEFPVILATHDDGLSTSFARRADVAVLAQQGPITPDHVIRTKRLPMLERDVEGYRAAYREYFTTSASRAKEAKRMLDPAPRVVLDPELGMVTVGPTAKDAQIAGEIYRHTIECILRATALGGYQALPTKDIFDVEYWDLEQAKLRRGGKPPMFTGEIALVTGAASGIGKACVDSFLRRGAAVIGLDVNPAIERLHDRPDFLGITGDVTNEGYVVEALERSVRAFGGLDMLVLNAGIFPPTRQIEALSTDEWRKVMQVNLDANLSLMRECHPLLKLSPKRGRVVIIGSKNVPAPGPGAAAYSASKAALHQLARVAALEWGRDGIRVNTLHPNAVFDTGMWTEEVMAGRAKAYGLTIEEYKTKNVLGVEITSRDVAELAAEICGPLFAKTTGAQVPVDGGNERVI